MGQLDIFFQLYQVHLFDGKIFENLASDFVKHSNKQYHTHKWMINIKHLHYTVEKHISPITDINLPFFIRHMDKAIFATSPMWGDSSELDVYNVANRCKEFLHSWKSFMPMIKCTQI